MGLLPLPLDLAHDLPPSPPMSNTDSIHPPEVEAGPSTLTSSQTTSTSTATPPTSPIPIPPWKLRTRKRRRKEGSEDSSSAYTPSITSNPQDDFLPSPTTSTSSAIRQVTLRGGGKRPKRQNQTHPSKPNSQASSSTAANPNSNGNGKQRTKRQDGGGHTRRTTRSKAKRASSPSDLVTTSLEEIALEDTAVKSEIARLGLTLRDVKGDGNCLFRVLSDQGFGGEKRHAEIRKLVCDYLETHKDVMEGFVVPFMKDGEGYEGYVARMRQLKQFGSHIEIQAAARVFKRNIRVVMSTTSFTIPWQTEATPHKEPPATPSPSEVGPVPTTPSHRTRSKTVPHTPLTASIPLPDYLPATKEDRSMLWLALFSQAEHFQSVRRMGDREHGPAEVEDKLSVPHARDVSEAARRERGELVEEKKLKTPLSLSSKITQLLNSLPAGHGVTPDQAQNVLGRTHGDIGEAVEILLEEIDQEKESGSSTNISGSDSGSSDHVEQMLLSPTQPSTIPTELNEYRSDGRTALVTRSASESPSNTATASTESRSHSGSRSRSNSHTSNRSGNTSQTEPFNDNDNEPSVQPSTSTNNLSDGIKEMKVNNDNGMHIDVVQRKPRDNQLGRERRRSARLGTVGAW
ncbi:hypothetical protein I302_104480 [Kwoniella bestiolae CBS 10118]|uniref:OTU domain-containing protein n=1 Tax=Kwoniella bestiolae CBS 10118 TaxID=1296100 RepID=A0A1B9GBD5_9TREE|nr:hypothetical protein I302_03184 [Kwoniella bestiolae CBS 10118]OCF28327.1 hypothetical protein I302_03184 [Kwoniella bestiolae CBS 10118]